MAMAPCAKMGPKECVDKTKKALGMLRSIREVKGLGCGKEEVIAFGFSAKNYFFGLTSGVLSLDALNLEQTFFCFFLIPCARLLDVFSWCQATRCTQILVLAGDEIAFRQLN